ncbi:MAG: hypothetical protein D4Q77_00440 [Methanothrix sp.]|nr:MAG: hypothetical protein D4Q77_00440 [Methanothrix sp.]
MQMNKDEILTTLAEIGFKRVRSFRDDIEQGYYFSNNRMKSTILHKLDAVTGVVNVIVMHHNTGMVDLFAHVQPISRNEQISVYDYHVWQPTDLPKIITFFINFSTKAASVARKATERARKRS